jgi:2',3'-cyclic-nucleotide 2'-phosphodiesterase (5'-nucleotidase family)
MYLPFKKDKNGKYILIKDEIKIEGPLPSCEKIFSNLNNCEQLNLGNKFKDPGELINYYWHDKKIEKDRMTKGLFDKYYSLYKKAKDKKITRFIGFEGFIKLNLTGDSLLGNFMLDIIRKITKTDVSIVNFFMFSNGISPGDLSIVDFIKIFPYDKYLCTTELTGKELIKIIKVVQVGKRGFYPSSGLKQTIKIKNDTGNITKEVVNVQMYKNGNVVEIEENKVYSLASNNLILSEESKDDFAALNSLEIIQDKFRKNKIKCSKNNVYVDVMNYFKNKKVVDLSKEVDMTKQRIVIID